MLLSDDPHGLDLHCPMLLRGLKRLHAIEDFVVLIYQDQRIPLDLDRLSTLVALLHIQDRSILVHPTPNSYLASRCP
jgi:hypothetical protein